MKSEFEAPWWARNRHIQTIWPRYFQRRKAFSHRMEQLDLPDGDFVDVAWGDMQQSPKGMVVLFHGLEGSVNSHYANDMMACMQEQGWQPVMMHFRGCSGRLNRTPRAYHSGDTQDAVFFLNWLSERYPDLPKVAMGFSLGANMLLKLLGECPEQPWLRAAVAISPPMKLAECASSISQGFSRLYQSYLLNSMLATLASKMETMDYSGRLNLPQDGLKGIADFRDFDNAITAPLHGFKDADDYYQQCSSIHYLKHIETPTLILHAVDDPFMNANVIPEERELSASVRCEISETGGHVGFMHGAFWRPRIWLHDRVTAFFGQAFEHVREASA